MYFSKKCMSKATWPTYWLGTNMYRRHELQPLSTSLPTTYWGSAQDVPLPMGDWYVVDEAGASLCRLAAAA